MAFISYSSTFPSPAPATVLILGKLGAVSKVRYNDVDSVIGSTVSEAVWQSTVDGMQDKDVAWLAPKTVSLCTLSSKLSRHVTPSSAHNVMGTVGKHLGKNGDACIVVACERRDVFPLGVAVARAFPTYTQKSTKTADRNVTICFVVTDSTSKLSSDDIATLQYTATAIRGAADIVDRPVNLMHSDALVERAVKVVQDLQTRHKNISIEIIRGEELRERGMGGIYGVGKAAAHPPAMVIMSYKPEGASTTVAWVGKGIVYDTGGMSIKSKTGMPGMKRDCGGAAAICCAFGAAVDTGFTENLHAVLCIAENAVGPIATVPDDVHLMYSGKTVEINNTDAEGRLVLADGVVYARSNLKADVVLDMATLTGASGITTGKNHAALLTNSAEWEGVVVEAGLSSGEMVFPIVYAPELHFPEFNSAVADMKNSVADRSNAQCSCAGLFIGSHLLDDFHKPNPVTWIHIDMAYPVHVGERATGWGPALLVSLFAQYSTSSLLSSISPCLPSNEFTVSKRPKPE